MRRDVIFPTLVPLTSEYRGRLIAAMEDDPEKTRTGGDALFGIENSYKVYIGPVAGASGPGVQRAIGDRRGQSEIPGRQRCGAQGRCGRSWSEVDRATAVYRSFYPEYSPFGGECRLGLAALRLCRGAGSRRPGAREARRRAPAGLHDLPPSAARKAGLGRAPVYPWLEELRLGFWLSKTRELLTADDPRVKKMLGRQSPEQLAERLVAGTKLADPAVRRQLWQGGIRAIRQSDDPMIKFVLAQQETGRALLDRYRAESTRRSRLPSRASLALASPRSETRSIPMRPLRSVSPTAPFRAGRARPAGAVCHPL
jgi:hypothetical protein